MKKRRSFAAGLLLAAVALFGAACASTENPQGWAAPATDKSTIVYLSSKDKVSAANLDSNATTWTFPDKNRQDQKDLSLQAVYGEPVIDGDTVYFASYSSRVFAVNLADGQLKVAPRKISGSIISGPTLAGDNLAVGTSDHRLYLLKKSNLSAADGWPEGGIDLGDPLWAAPIYADGALFVATMGGDLLRISLANGNREWAKPFNASGAIADLAPLPGGRLFVPSINKHVYIVDMKTGQALKDFAADDWVWTRPAVDGDVAYFGDFGGTIYALDINTGSLKWSRKGTDRIKAGPAVVKGVVVVADRKPAVHFLSAAEGNELNTVPIPDAGTARADVIAAPDGAAALVLTTGGKLFRADVTSYSVTPVSIGQGK